MSGEPIGIAQRAPFAMVPNALIDARIGPRNLLVFVALSRHANRHREARPTVAAIGRLSGLSERSTYRALRELQTAGWIMAKADPGRVTHYLLNWEPTPATGVRGTPATGAIPTPATGDRDIKQQDVKQEQEVNLTTLSGAITPDPLPRKAILKEPTQQQQAALEILEFLNHRTGHHYRPVEAVLRPIIARLREGATITQVRSVIGTKTDEWKDDPKMAKYLRPKTLFAASNFADYSGQLPALALQVEP